MNFLLFFVTNLVIINSFKFKTFKGIINGVKYTYDEPNWTKKIYHENKKHSFKNDKKSEKRDNKYIKSNRLIISYDAELDFLNYVDMYGNWIESNKEDLL